MFLLSLISKYCFIDINNNTNINFILRLVSRSIMNGIYSFPSYLTTDRRSTIRLFPALLSIIDYTQPSIFFCSYDPSVVLDKRKPFIVKNRKKNNLQILSRFLLYFSLVWVLYFKYHDVLITYGISISYSTHISLGLLFSFHRLRSAYDGDKNELISSFYDLYI
jgi:hypothetical protein